MPQRQLDYPAQQRARLAYQPLTIGMRKIRVIAAKLVSLVSAKLSNLIILLGVLWAEVTCRVELSGQMANKSYLFQFKASRRGLLIFLLAGSESNQP
jgi:hypothetical protein